ncbi:hypothetical protein V6N12_036224 [Hibiscus sabdariffa]|uniref:Uncharacterized protein n=1 Tax=Hibiscus sabdariffa TaxID=183260 RepID=A0ABR2ERS9_9ROSI
MLLKQKGSVNSSCAQESKKDSAVTILLLEYAPQAERVGQLLLCTGKQEGFGSDHTPPVRKKGRSTPPVHRKAGRIRQ